MTEVITRFGPSPTGFLHIGAIRTALFAYLYARANGGKFILRIEDTDRVRTVAGAVENIQESLKWLGLHWDEGPIFQSQRLSHYHLAVEELLQRGKAYYCICSSERLEALRVEQQKNKLKIGYDGHCRELNLKKSAGAVVRFKIPAEGQTRFHDVIRGEVVFENKELDDLVLLKSDGYPTYHLAHVVDDHGMNVSHVHRGEEWIPSAPKHVLLFQALGWTPPQYVHLPVILSQTGGKLSKRKGSVFVSEFRDQGYLPEAMVNFMVLLGWGFAETEEMYTLHELEKIFRHENINKAAPVFSSEKLDWFNGIYLRQKSVAELAELCRPYLAQAGYAVEHDYLLKVVALLQERIQFLPQIVEQGRFFFVDELAVAISFTEEEKKYLHLAHQALSQLEDFSIDAIDKSLREVATINKLKPGNLFMPIRISISGSKASPGLFETLHVLGKEKVLRRLGKVN